MQPGDEVICSYEEYTKFKKLDTHNKELLKTNDNLKRTIQDLTVKLSSTQHKLVNKNALLVREQLKVQCLVLLLDDVRCALDIKPETIGHGFKEIKGMDESSKFSVLRAPSDKPDIDQRLPEGFSKSNTYMEVSIEFECYKALVEVCGKEWKDKLRVIEYLEKEMQNGVEAKTKEKEESKVEVAQKPQEDASKLTQQLSQLQSQNNMLKQKVEQCTQSLKSHELKYKKLGQKQTQQIATLKSQLLHMEEQLLASTKALKTIEKPISDPKTRLISMITDYTISLSEGMMQLSVSAKDKQAIVEREVKEVEDVFRESIRQLYA